jgi:hypothetical protein
VCQKGALYASKGALKRVGTGPKRARNVPYAGHFTWTFIQASQAPFLPNFQNALPLSGPLGMDSTGRISNVTITGTYSSCYLSEGKHNNVRQLHLARGSQTMLTSVLTSRVTNECVHRIKPSGSQSVFHFTVSLLRFVLILQITESHAFNADKIITRQCCSTRRNVRQRSWWLLSSKIGL